MHCVSTAVFNSNFWFYNSLNVKCLMLNFNDLYYDNMETGHALSLQPRLIQIYPVIRNFIRTSVFKKKSEIRNPKSEIIPPSVFKFRLLSS